MTTLSSILVWEIPLTEKLTNILRYFLFAYMCVLVSMLHHFNRVWLFVILRTIACQIPLWILQAKILEWVAMPFSKGSSHPRDWTCISHVSCIGGGFFTASAIWEAQYHLKSLIVSYLGKNLGKLIPFTLSTGVKVVQPFWKTFW